LSSNPNPSTKRLSCIDVRRVLIGPFIGVIIFAHLIDRDGVYLHLNGLGNVRAVISKNIGFGFKAKNLG
jgi:hypothetical protein